MTRASRALGAAALLLALLPLSPATFAKSGQPEPLPAFRQHP
jgi:hypothetical protein